MTGGLKTPGFGALPPQGPAGAHRTPIPNNPNQVTSGTGPPPAGSGYSSQFYLDTSTTPNTLYLNVGGTWIKLSGFTGPQGVAGIGIPGMDGDEGPEGFPIPGPVGPQGPSGSTGSIGPAGPIMFSLDGEEGPEGFHIPGNPGIQGIQGVAGPIGFAIDGLDGDEGIPIPGNPGARGATGPQGAFGFGLDGVDGEDYSTSTFGLFLPLACSVSTPLTGPLYVEVNGTPTVPAINLGPVTGPGFYTDGVNLFIAISGALTAQLNAGLFTVVRTGAPAVWSGQRAELSNAAAVNCLDLRGQAFNSTGATNIRVADIIFALRVPTLGSETGSLQFLTFHGGSNTIDFIMDSGNLYTGVVSAANLVLDSLQNFYGQPAHSYSHQSPVTGFAFTIGNQIGTLLLTPAGTLATGTITMPAAPVDGQEVAIATTQTITALTVSANAGQTISAAGLITTLAAGGFAKWKFVIGTTNWYRVG